MPSCSVHAHTRSLFSCLAGLYLWCAGEAPLAQCQDPLSSSERYQTIGNVSLAGTGVITAWGLAQWDYFDASFNTASEGWFGRDTKYGGADKLGHIYTTYVTAQGLSRLFEYWCFSREDAARGGALSSLAMLGYMELGDGFSEFGFSHEDLVANALGGLVSYWLYRSPQWSDRVDLRWEFDVNPFAGDVTTDYENSKYLAALKFSGFDALRTTPLRYFEVHLGYFTRGYDDGSRAPERNLYAAIGLNLTDLLRQHDFHAASLLFKYYQPPGTYWAEEHDLNR
ncbi:DUF2279 domain-containing protein [Marinobacteraceae bacterium S3BR75-40.1]